MQTGLLAVTVKKDFANTIVDSKTLAIAGLFVAFIWLWVVIAGQIIQRHWRKIAVEFENDLYGDGQGPLSKAADSLQEGNRVLISITTALGFLSIGFVATWVFLVIRLFVN